MMLVRTLGGLFSSLLPTLPTAPTLGVSPPSVPSAELVEVQDTSHLTSFSINGEHFLNTSSERRGWLLRASANPSNEGAQYSRSVTGDYHASSLTCVQTLA